MTNKLKYFIGNWKMFGDFSSFKIVHKINQFSHKLKNKHKIKIILCVPNTLIYFFRKKLKTKYISLGVQNCHSQQDYGPFTGAISSLMLKKAGAEYIILGHSENRQAGETNKLINLKIKSALKSGLKVIFCIGETLQEKRKKITKQVLNKQIKLGLNKIKIKNKIIIAYEPVWSIGTGLIPKTNELFETINFIKNKIKKTKVLYGGSVNSKNVNELKSINNIDGYLIGGASQDPKKFIDIIKKTYN